MIAPLIGLDYERFIRPMLLSQGQFSAFLNAKTKERVGLLEELTGMKIYGQISIQLFEKYKTTRLGLEKSQTQASGIALLAHSPNTTTCHFLPCLVLFGFPSKSYRQTHRIILFSFYDVSAS